MTNTLKYISIAAACAALAACDNIKQDERFIQLPAVEAQRVVILEEYTGQNCVNCYKGHEAIAELKEQYPDNFIAVSIHGGPLAMSEKEESWGLANGEGNAYYEKSKVSAVPQGIVDRQSGVLDVEQWAAAIRQELARPAFVDMECAMTVGDDGKLYASVDYLGHDDKKAKLVAWVVENGIVARQLVENKVERKYVHNNVYRKALTPLDGQDIYIKINEAKTEEFAIDIDPKWDQSQIYIVAFAYDSTGILQACASK